MMPEMDGLSLLGALRTDPSTEQIPVIMLTAKTQVEDRIDARTAGAEVYLTKPFNPRELRSAVAQLLHKRGQQVSFAVHEQVRSLETISAGLAHEIHNPLSYIRTALYVISESMVKIERAAADPVYRRSQPPEQMREARVKIGRMYAVALKGVERINRIVELLRNYAREGFPSEPTPMCLDDTVRDMSELLAPSHDHEILVELDLHAGSARVSCIPEEMQRAIGNLWQNALDAVGPGGRVTIKTRVEGSLAILEVADNGPGIPREELSRIFAPFYTSKDPGQGLGLGLSIAYQVITHSGGSLTVESVEEQGSTFRVRLPVFEPSPEQGPSHAPSEPNRTT
jgi:signal transduction histidine kinase